MQKLLVFHPIIAPYRIDFFNTMNEEFETKVCLSWRNLHDQTFQYDKILEQLTFEPLFLDKRFLKVIPKGIWRELRNYNPDIVLVSECGIISILVVLFKWLFRKKYKIVSIVDDSHNMVAEHNQFSKRHEFAEKILIPLFDNIINVEPRVSEHFQKLYGKGVFFPIIVDEAKSRAKYERILPVSERLVRQHNLVGKKVLLFVGRLVELKNLQMVIPAFRQIENPDIRFVIVGSGEYEEQLKAMAEGDERIIFVGRKEGDELYAWYNIAQCFILASYQEAFGAVTNEALLGGCWSLVSEKAGSQCLIEDDKNGHVFRTDDKDGLRQLISQGLRQSDHIALPLQLRDNLMRCKFKDMMTQLLSAIQ